MTRELKLALIVGFSLVLVVMVLVSDHLSKARKIELAPPANEIALAPKITPPAADVLSAGSTTNPNTLSDPLAAAPAGALNGPTTITQGTDSYKSIEDQKLSLEMAANRLGMATRDGNKTGLVVPTLSDTTPGMTPPAPFASSEGVRPQGDIAPAPLPYANGRGASLGMGTQPNDLPGAEKPAVTVNEKTHTVEAGQSLYAISKQYYGNAKYWKQLLEYNKATVKSESALKLGMKIKVPDLATLTGKPGDAVAGKIEIPAAGKDVVAKNTAPRTGKGKTYTVVKGDTPGAIAKKALGTSKRAHELMDLNKINDDAGLKIGMVLQLPE